MNEENDTKPDAPADPVSHNDGAESSVTTTRRAFFGDVGKKAAYITPVLLTLSASSAAAGSRNPSCQRTGSPCTIDDDCCGSLTCTFSVCG